MMPGKKNRRFTKKEERLAEHIKDSEKKQGRSDEDAERIGYATVNKQKKDKK
jgi:hypothetical protein